jgi:hypothetical protein
MTRVLKLTPAIQRGGIKDAHDTAGAVKPVRIATLTRRSTDDEHQPYSIGR